MKDKEFLEKLKSLLERYNQAVTDIEMTQGNYDTSGKLITEGVPTITTEFCEIGRYQNQITYFTFILYPDSFSKALFQKLKGYKNMHIYGFKNFLEDLYPKKDFSYEEFEKDIRKDKYVQIQFNFDTKHISPQDIFDKYLILIDIFQGNKAHVVEQMTHDFGKE